jgi:hypothetical protein
MAILIAPRWSSAPVTGSNRRPVNLRRPFFDPTVIWMSNDQMALTGFERDDTTGGYADYAKTWLCEECERSST